MTAVNKSIARPLVFLAATYLLAAGCTTVGPDFEKPEAAVADNWSSADEPEVSTEEADYQEWWQVFSDPVLTQLIETAYQQNLSLQIAGLRILEARAQLGIAVGLQYPQSQSVSAGVTRSRSSENAPPFSNLPPGISSQIDPTVSVWDLSFDAAWEADVWGRFKRGIEAADAGLAANMLNYDAVLVTLTGDIAAVYTQIRTIEERLAYLKTNVELQKQSVELATARFRLGATSELDVQQALSLLHGTESLIPVLELGLGQAKNILSLLLGMPPGDVDTLLGGSGTIPVAPAEVAVGIPADLIRRRPDVRAAEMAAAAQSAVIGVSQADLYPHFVLAGSLGVAGDSFSDQFESGSRRGFITPFFRWDIFNYGRIKNNVRVQDARFEQLVVVYQNSVLNAAREVEDGLLGYLRRQEQVGYLDDGVAASAKAAELALKQYEYGAVDYTRVLNTQTALLGQQDSLAAARGQVVISLVSVYKALGGGWQIRSGQDYINPDIKRTMGERTDWGDFLTTPAPPVPQP